MDAFKLTVILTLVVAAGILGALFFITQDSIDNAKIPDVERGLVTSKAPVSDNHPADYTVNLSDGKILYIQSNSTLYQSILENQTYVFTCRIDFNNKMTLIDSAELVNATNP
ncbi:MAG: hypothetical protein M1356_07590 [Gammaproteobacteria bacterium]|nr:hypothetical protein [Gammaproteobacteria bacterium]